MARLGLRPFLDSAVQSYIITAFRFPEHPAFSFTQLYRVLSDRGFIIYPGKLTKVDTFRIGTIGRIFPTDIEQLTFVLELALKEMGVRS
jgi:2-aminoethylphosphonate-pyruvate transaminase